MTIKQGTRLSETGLVDDDLRTARALSLDTVDELSNFVALFPDQAARLFHDPTIQGSGWRSDASSMASVADIDAAGWERIETGQGFGALPPTAALADQRADLALDEADGPVPGGAEDLPRVHLPCPSPVRHQAERSTCVAHTVCALLECTPQPIDLSEQFLYWLCKEHDGAPAQAGTWQRVAVPLLVEHGVLLEQEWPYRSRRGGSEGQGPPPDGWAEKAEARRASGGEALNPRSVEAICARLDAQQPVGISVPVFVNWRIAQLSGDIPMPLPEARPDGGHAMCALGYGIDDGYLGGGYLILRNSWGTGWAEHSPFGPGYGTIPFSYIRRYGWEAFTVQGPT